MQAKPAKLFEMVLTPQPPTSEGEGQVPGLALLEVRGFLDARAIHDFDHDVQKCIDEGFIRFILDTHDLTYISSAGIGSLMRLSQNLARLGGEIVLLPPPDKIYAIFELLDFTKVLRFVETKAKAVELLRGNA